MDQSILIDLVESVEIELKNLHTFAEEQTKRILQLQSESVPGDIVDLQKLKLFLTEIMCPNMYQQNDIYFQVVDNLKMQVDNLLIERDIAFNLWKQAMEEIDCLDIRDYRSTRKVEAKKLESLSNTLEQNYDQVLQIMTLKSKVYSETDMKHCGLKIKLSQENGVLKRKVLDLENEVCQLKKKCEQDQAIKQQYCNRECEQQDTLNYMEKKLQATMTETAYFQNLANSLENKCQEFRGRIQICDTVSHQTVQEMSRLMAVAESSTIARDEANQRVQQMMEEAQQLQKAFEKLINASSVETREAVERVKELSNQNLLRVLDELHRVELDKAEALSEKQTACREKMHFQEVYYSLLNSLKEDDTCKEMLADRCAGKDQLFINLQRERDYLESQIESLKRTWQIERSCNLEKQKDLDNEIVQLKGENSRLQNCIKSSDAVILGLRQEQRDAQTELKCVKQELLKLRKETRLSEDLCKQNHLLTLRQTESKYKAELSCSKQAINETRRMLLAHQQMTSRWKRESHELVATLEAKLESQRRELKEKQKHCDQLVKQCNQTQEKIFL